MIMKKIIALIFTLVTVYVWASDPVKPTTVLPTNYRISMNYIMPRNMSPRSIENGYTIEMRGDTATMYLPYIGEARSAAWNNDGIDFKHVIKNKRERTTKKGARIIFFDISHSAVIYSVQITAFNNNVAEVDVTPSYATTCSYRGEWEEIKDEEKKEK